MSVEDRLYKLLKIYKKLPYPVKNVIGILYRVLPKTIKYGEFYFSYLNRLKQDYKLSESLLKEQLKFAVENIPYYSNINGNSIKDFPIVNKDVIKENFQAFINPSNKNRLKANTGGSSGTPFEFLLEKGVSRPKEKAHFDWYWKKFGYFNGDKLLVIRGESLKNNAIYERQAIGNKLILSCYTLNKENIKEVVKEINKFRPEFIHGYPSALKNLIFILKEANIKSPLNINIKTIFLGSEGLNQFDRALIEKYFKAKVINWYGHSERLVHAGNCPHSNLYHIFPLYGYVELLDNNDNVINQPNIKGRIVATGFDNKVMPLIRYDTGDEAEYSEINDCPCGFKGKSFKMIHGRQQDYIFLNDNTRVSLTAFIFGQHFDEFAYIKEMQLQQDKKGKLIIRIVGNNQLKNYKEKFLKKLEDSVNNKIKVDITEVDYIEKTPTGKHRFLIQNIKQ